MREKIVRQIYLTYYKEVMKIKSEAIKILAMQKK